MADQNKKVQSLLSTYYFLLLEPDSERSKTANALLIEQLGGSLTKDKKNNQITINIDSDTSNMEWTTAELILSMVEVTSSTKNKKGKGADKIFIEKTSNLFKFLGELKEDKHEGIWWELYVPLFSKIADSEHMDTFCHYVRMSTNKNSKKWLEKNPDAINKFAEWLKGN